MWPTTRRLNAILKNRKYLSCQRQMFRTRPGGCVVLAREWLPSVEVSAVFCWCFSEKGARRDDFLSKMEPISSRWWHRFGIKNKYFPARDPFTPFCSLLKQLPKWLQNPLKIDSLALGLHFGGPWRALAPFGLHFGSTQTPSWLYFGPLWLHVRSKIIPSGVPSRKAPAENR